ncbi:nuclear pore complex protein Nup214 [Nymphalis io]|uniref:nuclear pore complex protein Nup214 n=1 Tax=Inachis io TaxID=171585 RepID=UPI0021691430|nr:nuclear pore complex protein Nup214 [Nymphalis io]
MEIQFGPNAIDEPSLLYKLQRKIKVFNTNNPLPNRGYNLVACTSRYGIVFVASPNAILSVYYLQELIDKECEPQHLSVNLLIEPSHIAVNCNQEWLAVIGGQSLLVYKCMDFHNADIRPSVSIKCDVHPSTFVSALQWNPCLPDTLGIIFFDGTLLISQISTMQVKKVQSNARCLCWSPKGKQIVTGNNDGTLTQYKPDLSPMKMVPTPKLFDGSPVEALAIYWISTYQFAVAYRNSSDNSRPVVTIVNTPKGGSPSCYNYDDVCYSMGANRPWYYYLQGLAQWNIIISSSSNSMEIATLSTTDGSNWIQWCQTDEARPELPLTDKRQENYPVGICIDTAAIHQLPWGENETLPPMPLLHVVSQTGLLSIYNIVNLNKSAPQLCTPPQPIALPANALTRNIPDDVPSQPEPPPVAAQPKQQVVQQQTLMQSQQVIQQQSVVQSQPIMQPQPIIPEPQKQPTVIAPMKTIPQQQTSLSFISTSLQMTKEPTPPAVAEAPISVPQPKPSAQAPKHPAVPSPEISAALKLEQERIIKAKANQELKNMLIKEVNDFQMELYNFMKLAQENRDKFTRDIQSINLDVEMNMNVETLKKECDIEDLRDNVTQLKLELVRACAVVAESRTLAEAKDHQEWTQMDPLTAKRIASVKKLAYYVQNQLDQALKALDFKWNEIDARDQFSKTGERMIRPILDDVYQPLVKQQEILCRQQAELKTLRKAMNECNFTPMFKSTSLLRSTPFKNKDPLSKLTKNILNMSIEPQNKAKEQVLNSQKLDALRDMLSNHKPIKIKPVNLEITQHLETLKQRYANSIKEKKEKKHQQMPIKIEPKTEFVAQKDIQKEKSSEKNTKPQFPSFTQMPIKTEQQKPIAPALNTQNFTQKLTNVQPMKSDVNIFMSQKIGAPTAFAYAQPTALESKPDIVKESPVVTPSFTPATNLKPVKAASVARTLFTDNTDSNEKPSESPFSKPPGQGIEQAPVQQQKLSPMTPDTKSLLRKMILKNGAGTVESTQQAAEPKNDANTFMGQNICSPTAFSFSKPPTAAAPAAVFASKPTADTTNIFTKNQGQTSEATVSSTANPKSEETGEPEANTASSKVNKPKGEKPITNMFSLKSPLVSKNQNVPDVLKSSSQGFTFGKTEPKAIAKLAEDKSKKNVPEKPKENVQHKPETDNKNDNELKPSLAAMASKTPAQSVIIVDLKKPAAEAKVEKVSPSIFAGTTISPPPTASKPQVDPVSPVPPVVPEQTSVPFTSAENLSKQITITTTPSTPPVVEQAAEQSPQIIATSTPPPKPLEINENKEDSQTDTIASQSDNTVTNVTDNVFSAASTETTFSASTTLTTTTSESKPIDFSTPATTTSASVFSSTPQTFTSQPPAFAPNASSVFASASAAAFGPQTTQASIFGTATSTSSIFGSTTSSSIFGSPSAQSIFSAAASKSVFGNAPASTTQSIFGTSPTTTQASVFGTNQSVFGTSPTPSPGFGTPSTQASIFGTPPPATQTSVFGTPTQTTQASVFGSPTAVTQASIFGTPATTAQSGSLFGNAESNLFASASISTTNAPSQTSGGNIFGSSSNSVFGSNNTNVFGSKQGFTGANPVAASIFSGGGAAFGQKPATDFWSGGNTNAFGSSGFGQQQPTTQASSIFGNSGGSFSAPSAQPFGSPGPFSGGETKSVFGSPPQQQQTAPGAFGGSPVFGTKPMFGGQPGFGSSAFGGFNKSPNSGFGAPASFGGTGFGGSTFGNTSPSKGFGNASPNFGSPTQSNATFESLATQNTLTFGNLAQQSGQAPQPAPTFNASPSFTGWRG